MERIEHGFRIGFAYECKQAKTNMKSALDNLSVVDEYLATEVKMGCSLMTSSHQCLLVHVH